MHAALWCMLLVSVSLLPAWLGWTGPWYLAVALGLGAWFGSATWRPAHAATLTQWGRRVFFTSLFYLPLLFAAFLVDGRG